MPRRAPDPKTSAHRDRLRRIKAEYPLPPEGDDIKVLDVLNTDAVVLEGVFSLAQLEAVVQHMRALAEK